jgi:quinol monooxygenase YgiN
MVTHPKVIALLAPKAGKEAELENLLRVTAAASRREAGNVHYNLWRHVDAPTQFILDEMYLDDAAVAAHRASSHFQHYASQIGDLADRTVLPLKAVDTQPSRS